MPNNTPISSGGNASNVFPVNAADEVKTVSQVNASDDGDQTDQLQQLLNYVDYLFADYMGPWTDAVGKQAEFFKKVSTLEVTIANAVKPSGDKDKPIEVDCKAIYDQAKALYDEYNIPTLNGNPNSKAYLYASPTLVDASGQDAAYAQAAQWAREFGAPASSIVMQTITTNGSTPLYRYYVQVDRSPLKEIMNIFDPSKAGNADKQKFDPSTYSVMDTAKSAQTQLTKDFMNVIQQQYNRALTTSNNVTDMFATCNRQLLDMLLKML